MRVGSSAEPRSLQCGDPRNRGGSIDGCFVLGGVGAELWHDQPRNPLQLTSILASGLSATSAVSSSITAANTAFLTQSTAFVSAPAAPKPGQEGGGVWVRGVGGTLDLKSTTTVAASGSAAGFPGGAATQSTSCSSKFHQTFAGFQVGQDIARLNVEALHLEGWNIHLGTTAGALESNGSIAGGSPAGGLFGGGGGGAAPGAQVPFSTTSQSPYVGTYLTATNGSFYADGILRYDYYDTTLNSPLSNLFGQKLDARGFSIAGSVGNNYQLPNGWFAEPSAGLVWSRVSVDPLNENAPNSAVPPPNQGFSGTTQINEIVSLVGRAGFRVGTVITTDTMLLQPFVAASVWHEFGGNITANYSTCTNCFFFVTPGSVTGAMSTSNIGPRAKWTGSISAART
jgi:hypothetical protein